MAKARPLCAFCCAKPIPLLSARTCGDNACMSRHLAEAKFRKELADKVGETLTTAEMQDKYDVTGFAYCMCVVTRKSDGKRGSLDFTHMPRFYHSFQEG